MKEVGGRRYVRTQRRLQEIRESIDANAYAAEDLENMGAEALEKGDYDVAELCLREACLSRRDPTAMARFAQLMDRAKEFDRALRGYEFAVNQGLRKPELGIRLGSLYEKRRRFEEAHRLAERFIEALGDDANVRPFVELRRRLETKMGLRRRVDSLREGRVGARDAQKAVSSGPQRALEAWLRAILDGDLESLQACFLPGQQPGSDEFESLRESLAGAESIEIGGASEEDDRIRVRGRLLLPGGRKVPFGALLGRENSDWRLVSLELAPPAER